MMVFLAWSPQLLGRMVNTKSAVDSTVRSTLRYVDAWQKRMRRFGNRSRIALVILFDGPLQSLG